MARREVLGALNTLPAMTAHGRAVAASPNIVVILAGDQGYGDLTCDNPKSVITTHQTDRVARSGMRFIDVHSGWSMCSSFALIGDSSSLDTGFLSLSSTSTTRRVYVC